MSPFLANLVVGAILALVGWAIAFGVYVVRQDRAREREIASLREQMAGLEARFVTQQAWNDFNKSFNDWKDRVFEKLGHLGEQLAALTGQASPK
jgi:hypothetical protein